MKSNTPKRRKKNVRFAVCVATDNLDLEPGKVYRVLSDPIAEEVDWVRVVDESGKDYLYPEHDFVFINLPREAHHLIPGVASLAVHKRKSRAREGVTLASLQKRHAHW